MVKVFVDTNILIDFLSPSRGGHYISLDVFNIILSAKVEGQLSTQSIMDAAYICSKEKGYDANAFRETTQMLTLRTNVDAIGACHIRGALSNPDPDIEDNAQIEFAYDRVCDFFITNDQKLLNRKLPSPLKAMTPEQFVNCCKA